MPQKWYMNTDSIGPYHSNSLNRTLLTYFYVKNARPHHYCSGYYYNLYDSIEISLIVLEDIEKRLHCSVIYDPYDVFVHNNFLSWRQIQTFENPDASSSSSCVFTL